MLPGFSIETKPLTELEQKLLPGIVSGLRKRIGSANAVSNKEMCDGILNMYKIKISEARIRKIINHIRVNAMLPGLIANGCGYYVTNNLQELREYEKSLAGRENAIHAVRLKVKEHIVQLESKQQYSFNYK